MQRLNQWLQLSTVLAMSEEQSTSLRDKLKDGEYTIEIKDTIRRGKKLALNKQGERTLTKEENEQLHEYMEKYEDLIKEIGEIDSEFNGINRAWKLGELMVEAQEDAEKKGEANDFRFADIEPAISAFKRSSGYRYRLLYQMFPQGRYDSGYSQATLTEMAQRADYPLQARIPYERMKEADIRPTEREVRAWGDSTDEVSSIIEAVEDHVDRNPVEAVQNVAILHGLDSTPSEDEIEKELNQ